MNHFTLGKAALHDFSHGAVLLHVHHSKFGDDFFAAFDIKISIGENASRVTFTENGEMPLWEKLTHASCEGRVHNTFTPPCFCLTKAGRLSDNAFKLLLGRSKALGFAGDTSFGFSLLFFVFLDLGDEFLNIARLFDLFLLSSDLLLNLLKITFEQLQSLFFLGGILSEF